ncbi:class I SAM-dependent methyltransferase [Myxococcus sp. K15C18031901]|uniref:class I SAM-dependent methyltransferase n=1 Tax=Myxococcus dinghuensis TaxID=2906761 RepID=UPI0020A7FF2C|nr:class I SAM-dependent methyltransferase [Myxococcus dinghuensis]MCP3097948.1 class I SAM-dependent methyltransferase [Myxococcus dinghuensis]
MTAPRLLARLCLGVLAVATGACRSESREPAPTEPTRTEPAHSEAPPPARPSSAPIHGVGGVEGERAAYDESRQPAKFIAALGLSPGQRVADVGTGLGYFVPRLSDAVGATGQVVATDVDDEALQQLRERMLGRKNVTVRKVGPDDPGLEAGTYDLILLSEVDHFFQDRAAYLNRLRPALTPQGRIAVTHLRAMRAPLVEASRAAGYTIVSEYDELPAHYLLFLRPSVSR